VAEPPHLVSPVLHGRDIPPELLEHWPRGATVYMRLRVDARGYVSECTVDRGTGVAAIDSTLCNLAHDRLRFRPAVNRSGQAVAGWFGYAQPAPR
jgi:periplasmic protein TonB